MPVTIPGTARGEINSTRSASRTRPADRTSQRLAIVPSTVVITVTIAASSRLNASDLVNARLRPNATNQRTENPSGGNRRYSPAFNAEITTTTIGDRKSTRLNSSHVKISYAVFCL